MKFTRYKLKATIRELKPTIYQIALYKLKLPFNLRGKINLFLNKKNNKRIFTGKEIISVVNK